MFPLPSAHGPPAIWLQVTVALAYGCRRGRVHGPGEAMAAPEEHPAGGMQAAWGENAIQLYNMLSCYSECGAIQLPVCLTESAIPHGRHLSGGLHTLSPRTTPREARTRTSLMF
jgi:hypothetical protein